MENCFELMEFNKEVSATYIAELSGRNRTRGIHPIEQEEGKCVAVLCTLNGDEYPNKWLEEEEVLKYYFFGRTTNSGKKNFSVDYKENKAIIDSVGSYPIYTFVRNSKSEKFRFKGEFILLDYQQEADGAMYFILGKRGTVARNFKYIPMDGKENFPAGEMKERLHKYIERNSYIAKAAKAKFKAKHGKVFCEVCGFNFEEVYGITGADFIESHHTIPVDELKVEEETKVEDILLVCSNCHKMLHKVETNVSKEEIELNCEALQKWCKKQGCKFKINLEEDLEFGSMIFDDFDLEF